MLSGAALNPDLFWDSCVFPAYLRDENTAYDVASIEQYLEEARGGNFKIYTSSLVFAEVLPSYLTKKNIGSFQDFVDDFQGSIRIIDATPNVMQLAGTLRDLPYQKNRSRKRRLASPDAIMLASAVYLAEAYGVKLGPFHTFDDGKKRGPEGKSIPLLSFHEWCEGFSPDQNQIVRPVIELDRRRPIHPSPKLPGT